jgi:hypothetical protein
MLIAMMITAQKWSELPVKDIFDSHNLHVTRVVLEMMHCKITMPMCVRGYVEADLSQTFARFGTWEFVALNSCKQIAMLGNRLIAPKRASINGAGKPERGHAYFCRVANLQ